MLGPGGAPPGICRVICTIRMYEVHPDWRQQQGAVSGNAATIPERARETGYCFEPCIGQTAPRNLTTFRNRLSRAFSMR